MNNRNAKHRRLWQIEDITIDPMRELVDVAWMLVIAIGSVVLLLEVLNYYRP